MGIENKLTPEGLPVVSESVIDVFNRDMSRRISELTAEQVESDSFDYANEITERMKRDNPHLYQDLENYYSENVDRITREVKKIFGEDIDRAIEFCFGQSLLLGSRSIYECLRRQAEANKLNQSE